MYALALRRLACGAGGPLAEGAVHATPLGWIGTGLPWRGFPPPRSWRSRLAKRSIDEWSRQVGEAWFVERRRDAFAALAPSMGCGPLGFRHPISCGTCTGCSNAGGCGHSRGCDHPMGCGPGCGHIEAQPQYIMISLTSLVIAWTTASGLLYLGAPSICVLGCSTTLLNVPFCCRRPRPHRAKKARRGGPEGPQKLLACLSVTC